MALDGTRNPFPPLYSESDPPRPGSAADLGTEQSLSLAANVIIAEFNALRQEITSHSKEQDNLFRLLLLVAAGTVPVFISVANATPGPGQDPAQVRDAAHTTAVALLDVSAFLMAILAWPIGQRAVANTWIGAYIENELRPAYSAIVAIAAGHDLRQTDPLRPWILGWQSHLLSWKDRVRGPHLAMLLTGVGLWQIAYFAPATLGVVASYYFEHLYGIQSNLAMTITWWGAVLLTASGAVALSYHMYRERDLYRSRRHPLESMHLPAHVLSDVDSTDVTSGVARSRRGRGNSERAARK